MKYSWIEKPDVSFERLNEICQVGRYQILGKEDLPYDVMPASLLDKTESIFVCCSGVQGADRMYYMFNPQVLGTPIIL